MLSDVEFHAFVGRCRQLPAARESYLENDYITNLFLTVLDFRMRGRVIVRAMDHFRNNRWDEIRTLDHLQSLLSHRPDDRRGNTDVALYLWGNRLWTRTTLLRKLAAYFRSIGVISQDALNQWARTSDYERDFKGKIPGMAFAIYKWLLMRQGVETVKPDVHLKRFVKSAIHRDLPEVELVAVMESVARWLGRKSYELHSAIWEYQRGYAGR